MLILFVRVAPSILVAGSLLCLHHPVRGQGMGCCHGPNRGLPGEPEQMDSLRTHDALVGAQVVVLIVDEVGMLSGTYEPNRLTRM